MNAALRVVLYSSFSLHPSSFVNSCTTPPLPRDAGSWRSCPASPSYPASRKRDAVCRGPEPSAFRACRWGSRFRCGSDGCEESSPRSLPHSRSSSFALVAVAAAQRLVLVLVAQLFERVEGRLDHVVRIRRAQRLGQNVLNPRRFEDGAHRTAGDDPGPIRRRFEQDPAGSVVPGGGMRNGRSAHGDGDHVFLGDLDALLDGRGNFLRLSRSKSHAPLTVADDHQRAEAEVLSALDDLGHAVDVDDLVDHPAFGSLFVATVTSR